MKTRLKEEVAPLMMLVCVLSQVCALYFNSAQISLFERFSPRTDSDSADIILWDELVKGKHCSCYTVTHQAHAPAWVRKGKGDTSMHAHTAVLCCRGTKA